MSAPRCLFAIVMAALCTTGAAAQDGAAEPSALVGGDPPAPEPATELPAAVEKGHFSQFLSHSPFQRTLNLAETYALRGIAEIDGVQVATLYNRQTKKSVLVTADQINAERMQLKEVSEADFLNGVTATIAVADEEVSLKFEPERITPAPKDTGSRAVASTASSGGGSSSGSSGSRGPSAKDIERYKALPAEKQEKLREYIRQTMQRFPNMSREERGNLISGAVTRLTDGGDITLPGPPTGESAPAPAAGTGAGSSTSSSSRR